MKICILALCIHNKNINTQMHQIFPVPRAFYRMVLHATTVELRLDWKDKGSRMPKQK